MTRLRRTVLYVPADNARALEKSAGLPADVVIVDLEDAVSPERKEAAREAARGALSPDRPVALRINAEGTPWHEADVALAAEVAVPVILPKVRGPGDVERLATGIPGAVWPMMETAEGILAAAAIARAAAATGPAALVVGTNDLAAELGITVDAGRTALATALQLTVLAGRAAGLDVLDGVFNDVRDEPGLIAEATAGRALGMTGKTVIHPGQIGPVNRVFTPDEDAVRHARAIVAALEEAERAGRSVATLDGRLVERLHVDAAERTLALAKAAAQRAE